MISRHNKEVVAVGYADEVVTHLPAGRQGNQPFFMLPKGGQIKPIFIVASGSNDVYDINLFFVP